MRESSIDIKIGPARPEPAEPPEFPAPAKPPPARLLLIRHGQSTWNHEHRIQGQLDPPLSDQGRRQAELLGHRLSGRRYAAFYASDLKRAFETAEVIGAVIRQQPQPMAALREIQLGAWEGLRTEELAERFPEAWARWVEEPNWDLVPGGESTGAFEARVERALDDILDRHQQGRVLVVTHGGVIQSALHRVVGRPSRGLFPFKISNASITVLERRDGQLLIAGVNDVSHLNGLHPPEPGPG